MVRVGRARSSIYLSQDICVCAVETRPGQGHERRPVQIFKHKRTTPFDRRSIGRILQNRLNTRP